jgi:hypothetical protein
VQLNSFENIVPKWMPMVCHHMSDVQVILVEAMIEQRTHMSTTLEKLYIRGQSVIIYEEGENLAKKVVLYCLLGSVLYITSRSRGRV